MWWQELRRYGSAIMSTWVALLSGGASVLLALTAAVTEMVLPTWTFWLASVVCAWIAGYVVWRKEYHGRLKAEELLLKAEEQLALERDKEAARRAVLRAIADGERVAGRLEAGGPEAVVLDSFASASAWLRESQEAVKEHFPGQFSDDLKSPPPAVGRSVGQGVVDNVRHRLQRLRELLPPT